MKLYDITAELAAVLARVEEAEGEINETDAAALDTLEGAFDAKVENIGKAILGIQAEAGAFAAESKRLAERKRSLDKRADWLKDYLKTALEQAGQETVKGQLLTVALRKSPLSVPEVDMAVLPGAYVRIIPEQREADKKAILDHYRTTGETVPGATVQQGRYISIK